MESQLYRENIMDHYRNPRNFGDLDSYDYKHKEVNTLCGDEVEISFKLENNKIKDIKFKGVGCAISIASASILTELIKGKTLEEVKNYKNEELMETLGISLSPIRIKCAILSLMTLKDSIKIKELQNVRN